MPVDYIYNKYPIQRMILTSISGSTLNVCRDIGVGSRNRIVLTTYSSDGAIKAYIVLSQQDLTEAMSKLSELI